jgi:hypothetical protein
MLLNELHYEQDQRDRARAIRQRICEQRHEPQLESQSIRRAIGRSIIEIGLRIAAEPQPRLARSR